jgi:hypothetical protein
MMIHSMKRLVWGGLLAAGVVFAVGCDRGPQRPAIDEASLVGSWVEVKDKGARSPRMAPLPESPFVRHVTLNADKTFEFSLRSKSGEPKFKSEGTWAIEEKMIVFKVTSSTFPENDERRGWAPESSEGVKKKGAGDEVLPILDLDEMVVDYKRAQ